MEMVVLLLRSSGSVPPRAFERGIGARLAVELGQGRTEKQGATNLSSIDPLIANSSSCRKLFTN